MRVNFERLKWNGSLTQRASTSKIILHCTATQEGKNFSVQDIHRMHLANKWVGIGYHYLVTQDGKIYEGRPDNCVGAHAGAALNPYTIGICYVGGVDANNKAKDTRTAAQKEALFEIVDYCMQKFKIKIENVRAHYEFANKACPSFDIKQFRKEYLSWLSCKN